MTDGRSGRQPWPTVGGVDDWMGFGRHGKYDELNDVDVMIEIVKDFAMVAVQ